MSFRHALLPLALVLSQAAPANDRIVFQNGDTLSGAVLRLVGDQVELDSDLLGVITVPAASVASVNGAALAMPTPAPQEQPANALDFNGTFDLGFERDTGPADNEEVDIRLQSTLGHGRYLHPLDAIYEYESQGSSTTEEDCELVYQAERYAGDIGLGQYVYARTAWNRDRFRATDQWVTAGDGLGYVWRPTQATRLRAQAGIDRWWLSL